MSLNPEEFKKNAIITERSIHSSSSSSSPTLSPNLYAQDDKNLPSPTSSTSSNSFNLEKQDPPSPPYHVFTRSRKLQMVCIVSLAAIFSPLSSNIYFPALGTISKVSSWLQEIKGSKC